MGPVVQKLEKDYSGRIEVRQYLVDRLTKNSPEYPSLAKLAEAIHFQVTPTFLVVSKDGQVHGRYEGVTSYASLSRDLDAELAAH
jgi:hypothetical protein